MTKVAAYEDKHLLQLGLPGEWTATSWQAPDGLSFEDWEAIGPLLSQMDGAVHWWIGDWLNAGERRWGEYYAQAMDETGFSYETLRADSWVSERVESVRRRTDLSWSHHREVAALEPEEQDEWLDRAEANEWSRHQLRTEIRNHKASQDPSGVPRFDRLALIECAFKLAWHLAHGEGITRDAAGQILAECSGCTGSWDQMHRKHRWQCRDKAEELLEYGCRVVPIFSQEDYDGITVWQAVALSEAE